jgi:predicted metal-dependent peptidase
MSEAFLAARSKAALYHAYFGTALWALKFVEVPGFMKKYGAPGPVGVDKFWRIYYDPEIVDAWPIKTRMGVLVHELCHVLRRHSRRAEMRGG